MRPSNTDMLPPVNGSEMRRAPVEVGSEYPIIYKVLAPSQVVRAGFLNHQ